MHNKKIISLLIALISFAIGHGQTIYSFQHWADGGQFDKRIYLPHDSISGTSDIIFIGGSIYALGMDAHYHVIGGGGGSGPTTIPWDSVTGKPTISAVGLSGQWLDILNKPTTVQGFASNAARTDTTYNYPSWILKLAWATLYQAPDSNTYGYHTKGFYDGIYGGGGSSFDTTHIYALANSKADTIALQDTAAGIRLSIFRVYTPQMINPKAGDAVRRYSGAMTASSNVFTDATHGQFSAADVGKTFIVTGAGTGGHSLFSTVVSVTNSTTIVLANTAVATVHDRMYTYGTESAPAIQAAIDSCKAHKGSIVNIPAGIYLTTGALQDTTGANAQIVIHGSPYQFDFARSVTRIEGEGNQLYATNYFSGIISAPLTGTVVLSMLNHGNTQLTPSVWGMQIVTGNFNYDELQMRNITTLLYTDSGAAAPVLSAYGFRAMAFGGVYRCISGTDVDAQSTTMADGSHTAGFMLSHTSNGGPITIDQCVSYGTEYAYILAEHTHIIMAQAFASTNAYVFPEMAYPAHGTIAFQACKHGIVSPSSDFMGYTHGGGFLDLTIESEIDVSPLTTFWYNTVDEVTDTNCQLQGRTFWNNNFYNNTDYSNGVTSVGGCMLSINSAVQKFEQQSIDSTQLWIVQGTRYNSQTATWYQENNVASGLVGLFSGGFGFANFPASGRGSAPSYTWRMNITPDGRVGFGSGPSPTAWFQFHAGDATYPQTNFPESDLTSLHNSGDFGWDGAHLYFHTRTGLVNLLDAQGTVGGDGAIQYDSSGNQSGDNTKLYYDRARQELEIIHLSVADTSILGARISYASNYGSTFTPYSLIDKEYADSIAAGGTYTPSLSNISNVSASSLIGATWTRTGNIIHIKVSLNVTATIITTTCVVGIDLPFTSGTVASQYVGTGTAILGTSVTAAYGQLPSTSANTFIDGAFPALGSSAAHVLILEADYNL